MSTQPTDAVTDAMIEAGLREDEIMSGSDLSDKLPHIYLAMQSARTQPTDARPLPLRCCDALDDIRALFAHARTDAVDMVELIQTICERAMQSARTPPPCAGDDVELIEKWRADVQQCLDNLPAYAKQTGLSSEEVNGMEYAYSYALASMSDLQEIAALGTTPSIVGQEKLDG